MQLAVHRRSARLHVGDIEEVGVGPAGEADLQRLAYAGMRAVAARDIGGIARLPRSIHPFQVRTHSIDVILEVEKLRLALDLDAGFGQTLDQEALVLVLRKDLRIRKRTQTEAHLTEDGSRHLVAGHPEIRSEDLSSTLDHRVRQADLAVQLERARLHGQRARRRPRPRRPVDDSHAHAQPRQPQSQHQARRACADDEDVSLAYRHIPAVRGFGYRLAPYGGRRLTFRRPELSRGAPARTGDARSPSRCPALAVETHEAGS